MRFSRARLVRFAVMVVAMGGVASPAAAQLMTGVIERAMEAAQRRQVARAANAPPTQCVRGEVPPPPADLIAQARADAEASMHVYLTLAGASDPADLFAAYAQRSRRHSDRPGTAWFIDDENLPIRRVSDPLARMVAAGSARVGDASAYFRAIDGTSAVGHWQVMSTDGATRLGTYSVIFVPDGGRLQIGRIDLFRAPRDAEAIEQYCTMVGDIANFRDDEAEARRLGKPTWAERLARPEPHRD